MCRIGAHQDFHGIGVANVIFGIACIILPDHSAYDIDNVFKGMDSDDADFVRSTTAVTVINGLLFLTAGILLIVLARRMVENLTVQKVTQMALVLLIFSILVCPITFALNLVCAGDAADTSFVPPSNDDSTGTISSGPVGNATIDIGSLLTMFMIMDRFLDYKYGTSASLALVAVASFFMNIACALIICKQRGFRCLGRTESAPAGTPVPQLTPDVTRMQYQNQVNDDRAVVIQPLPERPGTNHAHTHFQDASTPTYRNPAFFA